MCGRCVRTSVGTRVPGRCSWYLRTAVGPHLQQLAVSFFNARACINKYEEVHAVRTSARVQNVGAVGTLSLIHI